MSDRRLTGVELRAIARGSCWRRARLRCLRRSLCGTAVGRPKGARGAFEGAAVAAARRRDASSNTECATRSASASTKACAARSSALRRKAGCRSTTTQRTASLHRREHDPGGVVSSGAAHPPGRGTGRALPHWRHHALITDRAEPLTLVEREQRRHAQIEFAIRDLERAPVSVTRWALLRQAAWLLFSCLAHNLAHNHVRWIARLGLDVRGRITPRRPPPLSDAAWPHHP